MNNYIYNQEKFEGLIYGWNEDEYVFIMDTNVLLNLYSFTPNVIKNLIEEFSKENRFLILEQVEWEYKYNNKKLRNKEKIRHNEFKIKVEKSINEFKVDIKDYFEEYNKQKLNNVNEIKEKLLEGIEDINVEFLYNLNELQKKYNMEYECIHEKKDIVEEFVIDLKKSINKKTTINKLVEMFDIADKRYRYGIPPGYTDRLKNVYKKDKKGKTDVFNNCRLKYGDYIIWTEILELVREQKKKIIFIQEERKEDWWDYKQPDKIPAVLKEEFYSVARPGSKLYLMHFNEFIYHMRSKFNFEENTIIEVEKKGEELSNIIRNFEKYKDGFKDIFRQGSVRNSVINDIIQCIDEKMFDKSIGDCGLGLGWIEEVGIDIHLKEYRCEYMDEDKKVNILATVEFEGDMTGVAYFGDKVYQYVPMDIFGECLINLKVPTYVLDNSSDYVKKVKTSDVRIQVQELEISDIQERDSYLIDTEKTST